MQLWPGPVPYPSPQLCLSVEPTSRTRAYIYYRQAYSGSPMSENFSLPCEPTSPVRILTIGGTALCILAAAHS